LHELSAESANSKGQRSENPSAEQVCVYEVGTHKVKRTLRVNEGTLVIIMQIHFAACSSCPNDLQVNAFRCGETKSFVKLTISGISWSQSLNHFSHLQAAVVECVEDPEGVPVVRS